MKDVYALISIVGFNPLSCLYAARLLRPKVVYLVHTEKSLEQSEVLCRQIRKDKMKVRLVPIAADSSLESLTPTIATGLEFPHRGTTVFDITGGTKTMMIAIWNTLQLYQRNFVPIHLSQIDGKFYLTDSGKRLEGQAHIYPEDYLHWQGFRIQATSWTGFLSDLPLEIKRKHKFLLGLYKAYADIELVPGEDAIRLGGQSSLPSLPEGFTQDGDLIFAPPESGFFRHGKWLEEFCLCHAYQSLQKYPEIYAALQMHLQKYTRQKSSTRDEVDVVLSLGSRLLVLEAKSGKKGAGQGAELQKRIAKTRTYFGENARLVFVHPSFTSDSLINSREGVNPRYVRLVGSEIQDFTNALKWGLLKS